MKLELDARPEAESDLPFAGLSETVNNFNAACARTLSRGLALYFSRPVRLFRPAKVTGWQFLKNVAHQEGALLTPSYVVQLCKSHGVWVVPKHFLPPMLLNAGLGTILWTSYGEAYTALAPSTGHHSVATAALSGAVAGGCQALLAAPAENVRLLLEGGSGGHSWSSVWKEVFQSRTPPPSSTVKQELQDIRELRAWFRDVGEMAGRGWDGWRWGLAKDVSFSAFFAIFEITRRASSSLKNSAQDLCNRSSIDRNKLASVPKIVNAVALVGGGVLAGLVYEAVCQPWDRIRRIIYLHRFDNPHGPQSIPAVLTQAIREEGLLTLVRDPLAHGVPPVHPQPTSIPPWVSNVAKTLARVGPWGIGFLGCQETDAHSTQAAPESKAASGGAAQSSSSLTSVSHESDGKETFSVGGGRSAATTPQNAVVDRSTTPAPPPPPVEEEEDDLSIPVAPGKLCVRKGCGLSFVSDEVNRIGDGEGTVCVYHPLQPIFREGSKGYLCCKRKVLEFDEFLKIQGCKTGRHCFAPKAKDTKDEELVQCRIDHYQTLEKIIVSVFAKKVIKEHSSVQYEEDEIKLDFQLPDNKRFIRSLKLFGPIDPANSSHIVLGTKV
ncbi:hypothetical protein EST38_g984 [Candolleomyces aberdarensis]|uniref:Uncharacterized protein n=1 Tax=Candolleomyces aberdarensis TaxID=2316362 RepID=A0A4Q2DZA2_9AGAR|nr:hypothetical protein EST38_g984 [Candolleomyces aberdarensis]